MTVEWQIIFLMVIFASAYFSYKSGFNAGHIDGIESALNQLEAQGVIELEELPEDE